MPIPITDFAIFDGQELVTYTPSGGSAIANVQALRRPLTKSAQRNVESFVELHATDVVFHLDAAALAAVALAAADALVDAAGQHYQVMFVERQSWNSVAVAVCRPA
ncbi:MAG TPA: hypothetical protein VH107_16115 [Lacipirellulaceae bacterium]|jgi:hypothetical protein|nr:hypothetical protein [Lacipirellulaceae bacterium]